MPIPDKIPIRREADYHTDQVGRCSNGSQYAGFCFFLRPGQQQLVAVLHCFDANGVHAGSEAWDVEPKRMLAEAIARLPDPTPGDIEIRPFVVQFFDTKFGLIPREDGECVEYLPYGLAFFPPWDGTYDT